MKKIFLIVTLSMSFVVQSEAGDQSSYLFPDESKLVFEYGDEDNGISNKLDLVSDKKVISFYNNDNLERVLINDTFSDLFYRKSEIVTAVKKENIIVVVFKLSDGCQVLYPVHTKNYGYAPPVKSKNDLLIKSFIKSNGEWKSYLSFYPQTLLGDVVDQSIKNVDIHNKDNYDVVYNGSWDIIGEENNVADTRKKLVKEEGQTIRAIKFDPINQVLFSADENGKYYSHNFIWWSSISQFNNKEDFKSHMKRYSKTSKKMNLQEKKYEYFSKADLEEQGNVLRKFQGKSNNRSGE